MLINLYNNIDMYDEFKDCWNDDFYPLAQLYWNGDNEENWIEGLESIGSSLQ